MRLQSKYVTNNIAISRKGDRPTVGGRSMEWSVRLNTKAYMLTPGL